MIAQTRAFAMMTAVVVLICCAFVIGTSRSPSRASSAENFPTGPNSPEGIACDLVRAYIAKDERLFHDRRCKVSCENAFDANNAYETLLQYQPTSLNGVSHSKSKSIGQLEITKVCVRPVPTPSEDASPLAQLDLQRVDLLFTYGAFEAKMVDLVAQTPDGEEFSFLVEAMQYPTTMENAFRKPVPSGNWRGRFIAVAESK